MSDPTEIDTAGDDDHSAAEGGDADDDVCRRMLWVFSQVGKMSHRIAAKSDHTPMSARAAGRVDRRASGVELGGGDLNGMGAGVFGLGINLIARLLHWCRATILARLRAPVCRPRRPGAEEGLFSFGTIHHAGQFSRLLRAASMIWCSVHSLDGPCGSRDGRGTSAMRSQSPISSGRNNC